MTPVEQHQAHLIIHSVIRTKMKFGLMIPLQAHFYGSTTHITFWEPILVCVVSCSECSHLYQPCCKCNGSQRVFFHSAWLHIVSEVYEEPITLHPHNVPVMVPDGSYYMPQIIIHKMQWPHKCWHFYCARYQTFGVLAEWFASLC